MKKVFLLLAPMYPKKNHNANLLLKTASHMNECNLKIICQSLVNSKSLPLDFNGIPVSFIQPRALFDRIIFHSLKFFVGRQRADDLLCITKIRLYAFVRNIFRKNDVIIATFQMQAQADAASRFKKTKKILYLMDPTAPMHSPDQDVSDEPRWVTDMLSRYDVILTTKFIKEAMERKGYSKYTKRIVEASFPLITERHYPLKQETGKITLLFAGTIYPAIRSPEYFLSIVRLLDERFRVIFIGNGCDTIAKHVKDMKAEVIIRPPVDYAELQEITENSDILINIGNSVPVHMPSKTLEYINTGKPIVNFYKFDDCPTLYYTNRYPLCLNMDERDPDINGSASKFASFCETSKRKQLDKNWIISEYSEATARSIANIILREIE